MKATSPPLRLSSVFLLRFVPPCAPTPVGRPADPPGRPAGVLGVPIAARVGGDGEAGHLPELAQDAHCLGRPDRSSVLQLAARAAAVCAVDEVMRQLRPFEPGNRAKVSPGG